MGHSQSFGENAIFDWKFHIIFELDMNKYLASEHIIIWKLSDNILFRYTSWLNIKMPSINKKIKYE